MTAIHISVFQGRLQFERTQEQRMDSVWGHSFHGNGVCLMGCLFPLSLSLWRTSLSTLLKKHYLSTQFLNLNPEPWKVSESPSIVSKPISKSVCSRVTYKVSFSKKWGERERERSHQACFEKNFKKREKRGKKVRKEEKNPTIYFAELRRNN